MQFSDIWEIPFQSTNGATLRLSSYQDARYKEGDFPITEALAKEVLSIPMYNGMTQDEIEQVIVALNNF